MLGIVVAGIGLASPVAQGASYSWQVQSGNWSVASNWGGTLPGSSDTACVANGGTVNVTVSETCGTLSLGSGAGSGAVQMASGYLDTLGYQEYIGSSGLGSFAQSGGTNVVSSGTVSLGSSSGGSGTYALGGSGLLLSFWEYLGYSGTGSFVQTGGANTLTSGLNDGYLFLGYNAGASGVYNLSGPSRLIASVENVGYSGTGELFAIGRHEHCRYRGHSGRYYSRMQCRRQRHV